MARLFSNMVLKGVAGPTCSFRSMVAFESFRRAALKYSTVNGDSEMHDDFKPTSKLADSGISVKDIVEKDVKENPVMIYMKGVPDAPRCGFSALAVKALQEYDVSMFSTGAPKDEVNKEPLDSLSCLDCKFTDRVPISARNILEDEVLKNSVKAFSNWPTFPQVFIKGEFIGGSDIILSMHKSGELKEKLKDVTAK